jgi:hypothetical protein
MARHEAERLEIQRTIMNPPDAHEMAKQLLQKRWMSAVAGIQFSLAHRQKYLIRKKELQVLDLPNETPMPHSLTFATLLFCFLA